jgi:carbamoyl-phosphate synthase large subunit
VLEANPRASRTVPFVSKATGVPLAKACARLMLGASIAELRAAGPAARPGTAPRLLEAAPIAVKEAVMPFNRFRTSDGENVDSLLGPEMKSTGEVMGLDATVRHGLREEPDRQLRGAALRGTAFVSIANRDKRHAIFPVKRLADLGFRIVATAGTAQVLRRNGIDAERGEGEESIVDQILAGRIDMVVNTPSGPDARADGRIREAITAMDKPIITTVQSLGAAVRGSSPRSTTSCASRACRNSRRRWICMTGVRREHW